MRSFDVGLATAFFLAAFFLVGSASATPITYNFTGTVDTAIGTFAGQGSVVTGFYTVDDSLSVDFFPGNSGIDDFRSDDNPGLAWEISVTVGSVTLTSADNSNPLGTYHHHIGATDSALEDEWRLGSIRQDGADDAFALIVRDHSPSPPDGVAVGSGNLDTAPILSPGDLSLYDDVAGLSSVVDYTTGGVQLGFLTFSLTSVTVVPEPSTALLVGAGFGVLAALRRRSPGRR